MNETQHRIFFGFIFLACAWDLAAAQSASICAGCHRNVWQSYRRTGMGRSFDVPSAENMSAGAVFYHKPSDTHFAMMERNGQYFQRGYQLDSAGQPVNVTEKRVDYVLGSGNHARTYLHRTSANKLIELPLGWYAEKGGYWAMNPGYDRPDHDGFRRPITYDCMFCHNAYPSIPAGHGQPFAESVYAGPLPQGIDCERCHGSGTQHVKLASTAGASREEIRRAIVNPARLSPERQMEGCMVCHLETTSFPLPNAIQRFERKAFSYQPGEPLAGFILNFDHAAEAGRQDKFEIVSAAYRLRRSACFLKSSGKMLCTTCHNPHNIPRGEEAKRHYTEVCRQCHAQRFEALVQAGKHTAAGGCVDCHMPKRRTEDAIHVVVTDHLIQRRKPEGDLLAERAERQDAYRGRVVLYYPKTIAETAENELTVAVAQVIQQSNLIEGIAQLSGAIEKYRPQRAEYYLELAEALQNNGQLAKALPIYRESVQHNPQFGLALEKLGMALRRTGQYAEAVDVLKRAAAVEPDRAITWHELGLTYQAQGRGIDAIAAMNKALAVDPDLPEAHNNLGIMLLARGEQAHAETEFREAIRDRLDYAEAHANLASLLSGAGQLAKAREEFAIALKLRPTDGFTRYRYAMMLGEAEQYGQAQQELEEALRDDPKLVDAHVLLGDLLMAKQRVREAVPHYREALRIMPESSRAHFGLGAALLSLGDRTGAIEQLKQAADGSDAVIRVKAAALLTQIEKTH